MKLAELENSSVRARAQSLYGDWSNILKTERHNMDLILLDRVCNKISSSSRMRDFRNSNIRTEVNIDFRQQYSLFPDLRPPVQCRVTNGDKTQKYGHFTLWSYTFSAAYSTVHRYFSAFHVAASCPCFIAINLPFGNILTRH